MAAISKTIQQIRTPTLNLRLLTLSGRPPQDDDHPVNNHQPAALMMVQELVPVPVPVPVINNVNNDILPIMGAPRKKRGSPNKQKSSSSEPKKKLKKRKFVDEGDAIIGSVVEHVKRNFGYNEVMDAKIIMEKKMTASDMKDFQGRLAIPTSKDNLIAPFLTRDEEELVNSKDEITLKKQNMIVKVISGMSEYEMPLARWDYHLKETNNNNNNNNNNNVVGYKYVLKNGRSSAWTKLREEQCLEEDDYILIATFRHNHDLHFVIVKGKPVTLFGQVIGHNYSFNSRIH